MLQFHHAWVLSFGSHNEASLHHPGLQRLARHDASGYEFKHYGRFQMALQSEPDFVYIVDNDMILGTRTLEILCRIAGTDEITVDRIVQLQKYIGTGFVMGTRRRHVLDAFWVGLCSHMESG